MLEIIDLTFAQKNLVTHRLQPANLGKPHNFIQLTFSNSPVLSDKITDLYQKGNSFRDIEKLLGISKTKLRGMLIKLKVPIRPTFEATQKATQSHIGKKNVKPPYGFAYFEGRVVKHPKEYPVLLQIIQKWKAGQSLNSIATKLNEKQVPSPMGKSWSWNSIDNIVKRIKSGHLVQSGDQYELR